MTHQLEVTLRNMEDTATYFKGTYTVTSGEQLQTVGDVDPVFIEGLDIKTVVYDLDPIVGDQDIKAKVYVIYGESRGALERVLEGDS